jgi:hypothetical protein
MNPCDSGSTITVQKSEMHEDLPFQKSAVVSASTPRRRAMVIEMPNEMRGAI